MTMDLAETQDAFAAALLDPALPVPAGVTSARGKADEKRFAVYRNNVAVGLTRVLASRFPVVLSPEAWRRRPTNYSSPQQDLLTARPSSALHVSFEPNDLKLCAGTCRLPGDSALSRHQRNPPTTRCASSKDRYPWHSCRSLYSVTRGPMAMTRPIVCEQSWLPT